MVLRVVIREIGAPLGRTGQSRRFEAPDSAMGSNRESNPRWLKGGGATSRGATSALEYVVRAGSSSGSGIASLVAHMLASSGRRG